jgi:hypothetical protein
MAKSADEDVKYCKELAAAYETAIAGLLKFEAQVVTECRNTPATAAEKLFELAGEMCNLASNYLAINGISLAVLEARNEDALNEGRKALYKAVIYLENVVTARTDAPFSEYETNLAELAGVSEERRWMLIRKLGLSIDLLKNAYGTHSKWKWSFVDIEGRFATIVKNLFDLKNAVQNTSPQTAGYETATRHYRLIVKLLEQAADRYIERFTLSTKRAEDVRLAVNYLGALKYVYSVFADSENVEKAQKKHDGWNAVFVKLAAQKTEAVKQ